MLAVISALIDRGILLENLATLADGFASGQFAELHWIAPISNFDTCIESEVDSDEEIRSILDPVASFSFADVYRTPSIETKNCTVCHKMY